ncbi:hypothetical protein C8J56DRAFT_320264 [Mycena floridula]|nr:hypothetical protein C8J56DRAFT_320264 [Mycena floridula]
MRRSFEASPSPTHKRRRLSSPSIDIQFPVPSQDELQGIDAIEARLSQGSGSNSSRYQGNVMQSDPDNPFISKPADFSTGFTSASFLQTSSRSRTSSAESDPWSSQDPPPEKDPDWFMPPNAVPDFQSASSMSDKNISIGFQTASKSVLVPSAAALAKAKAKMNEWEAEKENPDSADDSSKSFASDSFSSDSILPSFSRPAFKGLENATPATPSPATRQIPTSFASPLLDRGTKAFKPPFFKAGPKPSSSPSQLSSPVVPSAGPPTFTTPRLQHPLASAPITATPQTPARPIPPLSSSSAFHTPLRSGVNAAAARSTTPRFKTPFKPGMRPGEPGRKAIEEKARTTPSKAPSTLKTVTIPLKPQERKIQTVFDLSVPQDRKTLSSSGLRPQRFTEEDLESLGVDINDLSKVTPNLALYYSFYTAPATDATTQANFIMRNADTALRELLNRSCTLATKTWVDNHWALILWKLAGMAALDPKSEQNELTRRWSWPEMFNQLLYRYQRELSNGVRPPLRQIVAQDVPASCPMVLCVSDVIWPEMKKDNIDVYPEIEVTDGWYRIRAQVDEPLARAIRKGKLRIGRKISVVDAKLSSERKEPAEILEAYNSVKLLLHGNGSHLAPWHAKLGFLKPCPIATLHSVTPDGGIIPAIAITILQVFPIFHVEFIEQDGKRVSLPMREQAEEDKACDQWTRQREAAAAKIQAEYEKTQDRYFSYAERLERKAGNFQPGDDGPPDHIDSFYDELEDPVDANRVLGQITSKDAGWLALHIRKQAELGHDKIREDTERELDTLFPPRLVYSARMMLVEDAYTERFPAHRQAQLTVWDVTKLQLTDGKPPGYFEEGQKFHVTMVHPSHLTSWMGHEKGDQAFICTKSMSVWRKIK